MAGVVLALLLCFVGSSLGDDAYSAVYPPAYPPIYPPRCPPVPNPPYGYVKIVNYKCNYYCKDGYKLVGSSYRTCRSGSWYPDAPKCVPACDCPKLKSPPYGSVSVDPYGCKATYSCNSYYKLIGSSVRWCKKGVWYPEEPKCVAVCPYLSRPHYGWVKVDGYSAQYGCNDGYKLAGLSHRKCIHGKWGGYAPKCTQDCPDLHDPLYGWVDVDDHNATYGCNKGYKLDGYKWRYCSYGKWGGYPPKCIPECPDLDDPSYGWVKVVGHKAQYGCSDHYKLVGSQWRYCHYGKWGGHAPKCVPKCPKLDDPDYGWVDVDGYKASYGCDKGYELYGSKWRYCNYGKWGGYTPKCHPECPKLYDPKYGWVKMYGSKAQYGCDDGYKLVGLTWRYCKYGVWSGEAPKCIKRCADPYKPAYGYVYVSGNKATYGCNKGYKLVGSKYSYCSYDKWAPVAPKCSKLYPACPSLKYPPYGRVVVQGNKATYYCNDGYYMDGGHYSCYCSYGSWHCNPPKCLYKKGYVY